MLLLLLLLLLRCFARNSSEFFRLQRGGERKYFKWKLKKETYSTTKNEKESRIARPRVPACVPATLMATLPPSLPPAERLCCRFSLVCLSRNAACRVSFIPHSRYWFVNANAAAIDCWVHMKIKYVCCVALFVFVFLANNFINFAFSSLLLERFAEIVQQRHRIESHYAWPSLPID